MWSLAQYTYGQPSSSSGLGLFWLIYAVLVVVFIVAYWKIFTKAGEAGWKSIIPIYNIITALKIVGLSGWYVLLFLIPIVNIFMIIMLAYKMALAFGYGVGMTILELVFGVGLLIIGFGDAKYLGPDGHQAATKPAQ